MRRQRALLVLAAAFSAPLMADPLDEASMWLYEGASSGAKAPPETRTTSGGPATLFMTVFSDGGERQITLGDPDRGNRARPTAAARGAWTVSLGYRRELLDFSIAGPDRVPNILSELEWETNMAEIRLNGDWVAANGFTLSGEMAYASGFSGEVRDSDYLSNNRRREFSRSYSKSRGSTESRLAFGLGWRIVPGSRVGLTPMLGYTYQEHDLRARNGRQVVSNYGFDVPLGPFHGLDMHYQPRWHGPWLGLRFDARLARSVDLRLGVKHQWFNYRAEADWNLRSSFAHPVSFRQHGNSRGWQWEVGALWRLSPQSAITFTLDRQEQRLRGGTDRVFFSSGQSTESHLHGVNWDSWAANLGWRVDF